MEVGCATGLSSTDPAGLGEAASDVAASSSGVGVALARVVSDSWTAEGLEVVSSGSGEPHADRRRALAVAATAS